jgi:hypothetical protein
LLPHSSAKFGMPFAPQQTQSNLAFLYFPIPQVNQQLTLRSGT